METLLNLGARYGKPERCSLYDLVNSSPIWLPADNSVCKQFRPRPFETKRRIRSESQLCDTLMVLLKEHFEKVEFERTYKLACRRKRFLHMLLFFLAFSFT